MLNVDTKIYLVWDNCMYNINQPNFSHYKIRWYIHERTIFVTDRRVGLQIKNIILRGIRTRKSNGK